MNTTLERTSTRLRVHLRRPQHPVQLHTVVGPVPRTSGKAAEDERHVLLQQVLDQCRRSTEPLSVGEIAAAVEAPPGPVCVAVSDLLHEGTLRAHRPSSPPRLVLERIRAHLELEHDQPVETAKIVILGHPEETRAFLSHLDLNARLAVDTDVESSVSRLDSDLHLLLIAVYHRQALEQRWPDLMRDAHAAMLLARSDRLGEARASARLLDSREVPFHTVVHLADERDLEAGEVLDTLGLSTAAPVVMIDVHSPTAPVTVLRDLCTWAAHEDGVHV